AHANRGAGGASAFPLDVLLHAALYFGALAGLTSLAAMVPRMIRARIWASLPTGVLVTGAVTVVSVLVEGMRSYDYQLAAVALLATALTRVIMRRWSWLGAQLVASATLAALAYVGYTASITYHAGADFVFLLASSLLLLLELAALALSL